jgi:hypothetical protein
MTRARTVRLCGSTGCVPLVGRVFVGWAWVGELEPAVLGDSARLADVALEEARCVVALADELRSIRAYETCEDGLRLKLTA